MTTGAVTGQTIDRVDQMEKIGTKIKDLKDLTTEAATGETTDRGILTREETDRTGGMTSTEEDKRKC
jgi:hypothetical protein